MWLAVQDGRVSTQHAAGAEDLQLVDAATLQAVSSLQE